MAVKDLVFRLLGEDATASEAMGKLAKNADKSAKSIKDSFGPVPGIVSLLAAGFAVASVKMAADFQQASTRLVTDAGESAKNLDKVKSGMLDLSSATGTSAQDIASGMYTVESAGYHGAQGLAVMKAVAEGAKIGMADTKTVADALTTTLTDYGKAAGSPAQAMSMLTATVSTGKTNMEALAGSLHSVMPAAQSAGISLKELLGAVGTMTGEGISADQATQNLNDTIQQLSSPSSVAQKEMAQMGLSFLDVSQKLGQRGLTGTLQMMSDAVIQHMGPSGLVVQSAMNQSKIAMQSAKDEMAKMPPQMQKMAQSFLDNQITQKQWTASLRGMPVETANLGRQFATTAKQASGFSDLLKGGSGVAQTYQGALGKMTGGMTGLQVALHLTGDHMSTFKSNVDTIGKSTAEAGGHVRGWSDTQKGFNVQLGIAVESFKNMGIQFGTALLPGVTRVAQAFSGFAAGLRSGNPAAVTLATTIGVVVGALVAAYAAQKLMAAGATLIRAATIAATVAQWAYNVALDANPIGIVIMAIVALVAGLVWFFTQTKLGQDIWKNFTKFLGDAWNWLWNSVISPVITAISVAWTWLYNSIIKPYVDFWVTAFKVLEVVIWLVWVGVIQPVLNQFAAVFIWLWQAVIKPVIDLIMAAWSNLWNTAVKPFADFIVGALRVLGAGFSWLWASAVQPVINFIGDALHNLSVIFGVVFGGAAGIVKSAFGGVIGFVRGIFNGVIDIVNGIIGKINGVLSAGKAIGVNVQLGSIPHLATGGTMTRAGMALVGENGPEVVKLPAGATVYPHGTMPKQGGGGLHIGTFIAQQNQSPAELAQELGWMQRWAT